MDAPIRLAETEENYELYISSKIVRALPMMESDFLATKSQLLGIGKPDREGFHVIYPDGYVSWSPKEAFETANRRMTASEIAMIEAKP